MGRDLFPLFLIRYEGLDSPGKCRRGENFFSMASRYQSTIKSSRKTPENRCKLMIEAAKNQETPTTLSA
jgi:hypothetical protein